MKKQIIILGLTLLLGNIGWGQSTKNHVWVIGSSAGTNSTNAGSKNQAQADQLLSSTQFLNEAIKTALEANNNKIYIQEGEYKVNGPIVLDARFNGNPAANPSYSNNISIEGEGFGTKISAASGYSGPIFSVRSEFNTIQNLSIHIESNLGKIGIEVKKSPSMATQPVAGVLTQVLQPVYPSDQRYNIFENLYIGHWNRTNMTAAPTGVYGIVLENSNYTATAVAYNKFKNITIHGVESAILFRKTVSDSLIWTQENTFENFDINMAARAIDLIPASPPTIIPQTYQPFLRRNTFKRFTFQTVGFSSNVVNNIVGDDNIFEDFKLADWNNTTTTSKIFVITSGKNNTIMNSTLGSGLVHGSTDDYIDNGTFTQFINNARAGVGITKIGFNGTSANGSNEKSLSIIEGRIRISAESGTAPNVASPTAGAGKVLVCQDATGRAEWQTFTGSSITANQGITKVGNEVRLGDACGGSGATFTQNREVNLSNFNLYFNSKSPQSGAISDGKVYMGTNACQTLQSRLEISTAGQSNGPKNDYATPNPSTSGLRFTDLRLGSPTVPNNGDGVLSLDKDGDVIWVKRDLNGTCSTPNLILKSIGSNQYSCSQIFDNGTSVGVSTLGPFTYTTTGAAWTSGSPAATGTAKFSVNGLGRFTSLVVTSDMNLKKDIEAIENPNAIIEKLEGKTYAWKDEVVKETLIDNGRHYGFLAQEVEKVMPEAVIKDEKGRYAVEYNAFIPVLVESQKILIKENNDLKSELNDLKTELKELKALILNNQSDSKNESSVAILYQNIPNPFSNTTTIKYYVPSCVGECKIIISDMNGKLIYTHTIVRSGEGQFQFDASGFTSSGTYNYTLIENGKTVASKKMLFNNMK